MRKSYAYSILAALLLAAVAFLFFFPDDVQGNSLQQHDTMQGIANGQEGIAFEEATGETTRWTNSLFGGMPNFQIHPSYAASPMLDWIVKVYTLGLPSPANLLFGMMIGFFIMCMCMKMRWEESLFGSLAWGLSSYFIIIIGAGHIWKFLTLMFIPPTIGGVALCYRGKYLGGTALAALFGALQLQSNHPQMSYYFGIVLLALILAYLWHAYKAKELKRWGISTLCCLGAGVLALGANSASLYNSLEYSKETVRGRATELTASTGGGEAKGMDRDAITAWSYGIDESFSLLIPNVKGGATIKPVGGENKMLSSAETGDDALNMLSPEELQVVGQFPQYFGDQPMTNGPVYVGAFVLMLAILAMFIVQGHVTTPLKWALFASAILSLMLSWGHNFQPFTDFFIDNIPGYNKFRAVSSALVVLEFCIPLLAALALAQIAKDPGLLTRQKWTVITVMGTGAVVCFLGWVSPSIFGAPWSASETEMLTQQGIFGNPAYNNVIAAISSSRLHLVSADSLRSLCYIIIGCLILFLWSKKGLASSAVWISCISALVLIDLFSVNKRYVNSENFITEIADAPVFEPTPADLEILKDKSNYRVLDVEGFSQARSSYFHKTIGGYHAAKLTRYNDLIDKQISRNNPAVLNMLNTKYIISQGQVIQNPDAAGNAWFVDAIDYVKTPDQEMRGLDSLDVKHRAVADVKFQKTLANTLPAAAGDTIYETSYAPNRLTYKSRSAGDRVAIFSEIFFPWGWEALIDGKPAAIGRANYVLRALRIPAGNHEITFTFNPKSLEITNTISVVSVIIVYTLCIGAATLTVVGYRKRKARKETEKTDKS